MRSVIFNSLVCVSLVSFLVLQGLWIRSFIAHDRLAFGVDQTFVIADTFPHHVYIQLYDGWPGMPREASFGLPPYPPMSRYLEPRFIKGSRGCALAIPFWLPQVFCLAAPLRWLQLFAQRRRRRRCLKENLCVACGYDMRATPGRCPECGAMANQAH